MATADLRRGEWVHDKLKRHKATVFAKMLLSFLNKHSSQCHMPLAGFQSSEKDDFDHFFQCFSCCYVGVNFWKS